MLKRKSLFGLLMALLGLFSLFSMSLISTVAQDAPPEPTPIVEALGTGDLKISFWNGLTGSDGTTLNAMLAEFVAENPEITVTTEIIPWGTLYTKLQAAFVAGQPPDLGLQRRNLLRCLRSLLDHRQSNRCHRVPVRRALGG